MLHSIVKCSSLLVLIAGCERPQSTHHALTFPPDNETPPDPDDTGGPLTFSTQTIESSTDDDGFGSAVAIGGGHVWVGAPHGETGAVHKVTGTAHSTVLTGPGKLGSHLAWTDDGLWIGAPLTESGLGAVVTADGALAAAGAGGTGISLAAGPPAVYGWEGGWVTAAGQNGTLDNRPTALGVAQDQIGAGMALGPIALKVGSLEWPRPAPHDEAGFSVAVTDINGDGHPDWLVGAPGSNTVYGLDGTSLAQLKMWTGQGRFGSALTTCDVDGDGRVDLAVGAPMATGGGEVHLFLDLASSTDQTWTGHAEGGGMGTSLACADGVLVAGSPGRANVQGRVVMIAARGN